MDQFQISQPFQPYLLTGERLLWSGQPQQGLLLSSKDMFLIPFSLMWGGFAIFWNAMVWLLPTDGDSGDGAGLFFKLWGLPFLAAGLYLIAGRFIHDAHIRKKLFYAVTNQRVLTLRGSKIISLDIHRLPRLELSEHRDGTGTLAFEASATMSMGAMNGLNWWLPSIGASSQFFRIRDPRKVTRSSATRAIPDATTPTIQGEPTALPGLRYLFDSIINSILSIRSMKGLQH